MSRSQQNNGISLRGDGQPLVLGEIHGAWRRFETITFPRNEIRRPDKIISIELLDYEAAIFKKRDTHVIVELLRVVDDGQRNARLVGMVWHASVPDSEVSKTGFNFGNERLDGMSDFGRLGKDLSLIPATAVVDLIFSAAEITVGAWPYFGASAKSVAVPCGYEGFDISTSHQKWH